ncbi:MAG TPA: acyl carrier protein [Candidatus Polarisedimenticolaceae bacterium]|nr:acyl carrier protein [Candidatus Polarisedimenticolaceae bacterium]
MSEEAELARIREFVRRRFPLARQLAAGDDDPLLESGVVDSLGILELVQYVTQEFAVEVGDEDLLPDNFGTVRKLAAFVAAKRDGKPR